MIRSNSKKARENVRQYILEDAEYLNERAEYDGRELKTDDEMIAYAFEIFEEEKKYEIEKNYHNPNFGIFLDWARGLAMGNLFCYYYNRSAVEDLGNILEETKEERQKFSEQQDEEFLSRLIYREMEDANRREFLKRVR